ncbi:unnamed protein product [Trifolium pratense]|uniref:Uncharacterized protein n=1 Tax=Trifolium pratense TaxID=57577 RepID=A0ACB0JWF9_TRIPR|nr:unnamed protein product [Trifolium pratense]
MEDEETNEATPRAVEKLDGDAFVVQNEDWEKQSEGEEMPNIGHDDIEFCNEKDDVSSGSLSSHHVENKEGDAYVVQNDDHEESKRAKSQSISHDVLEYENEQDYKSSDTSTSQDIENLDGDAHVKNEDHEESKQAKSQNISHDGPKYENEQDDISSDTSSSKDVENLQGDAYVVQNVDLEESKQANSQNISHDRPEYENEHDDKSLDTSSSQDIENLEGDTYVVPSEDHGESKQAESLNISHDGPKYENEQDDKASDTSSSQAIENLVEDAYAVKNEDHEESKHVKSKIISHDGPKYENEQDDISSDTASSQDVEKQQGDAFTIHNEDYNKDSKEEIFETIDFDDGPGFENNLDDILDNIYGMVDVETNTPKRKIDNVIEKWKLANRVGVNRDLQCETQEENMETSCSSVPNEMFQNDFAKEKVENRTMDSYSPQMTREIETTHVVEKAVALKNFVREKSIVAVSTLLRRFSIKFDEDYVCNSDNKRNNVSDLVLGDSESKEVPEKTAEKMTYQIEDEPVTEGPLRPIAMKGRIILYTRLGCRESKEVRRFLYMKRLRYVEINIDVYPSRKMELEKISASTSVPKVFFNGILIGGMSELKTLNDSGNLDDKIEFLITESPSFQGPFPPLSGEDDVSSSGAIDELALIVRKMKESIVVKDRFSKLRRFTNCFLGCEAVDFLSEDQYLERKEAVEFGRKLAIKLFFQHVLDSENLFEDGNYFYRFLDDDPIVASQCQNIPRGIITVKPKPITEIASRLRFLSYAMFEAYASEDGRHVDYRSMHGSEEFARYLRIVEELQRVEIFDLSRQDTIAFFLNLYNMMTIHAILVWGHPAGPLERRRLFADFKYVIGGSAYSLSAIQNGILRGNQRQPYTLMKPFGVKDKRLKVALSSPEPLIHFAIVCGTRSGPPLRCYSPGDIDSELMDAARNFLRNGGILIDFTAKVAYASKILKWFSIDFGKNEVEVMKHVSIYLDPSESELLFDLLASSELKVIYQPYDWGLNC